MNAAILNDIPNKAQRTIFHDRHRERVPDRMTQPLSLSPILQERS